MDMPEVLRGAREGVWLARRTLALVAAVVAVCSVAATVAHSQQAPQPQDVIILLDTTASMVGQGTDPKAQNIFPRVVQTVAELIGGFPSTTRVMVMPFDRGVDMSRARVFPARPSPTEMSAYLQTLQPTGQVTYIYESVDAALGQLEAWSNGQKDRPQALYIYTDGLDNGPHEGTWIQDLTKRIQLHRTDSPYLFAYYSDLQRQLDDTQSSSLSNAGVDVVRGIVRLDTQVLDFGDVGPGQNRVTRDLSFFLSKDVPSSPVSFQMDPAGLPIAIEPKDAQVSSANTTVPLTLVIQGDVAEGVHDKPRLTITADQRLNFQGDRQVAVRFRVLVRPTATAAPATSTPVAAPTPTQRPPTAVPTAVPAPPPPPAPPAMTVNLSPAGPRLPEDTWGFELGWPLKISRPVDEVIRVTLSRPDDPQHRPVPFDQWFAPNQPPVFRVIARRQGTDATACTSPPLCAGGITFRPALGSSSATATIRLQDVAPADSPVDVRVLGDGALKDGRPWHVENGVASLSVHRPSWAVAWERLGLGYVAWILAALLVVLVISAAESHTSPAISPVGRPPVYYTKLTVKGPGDAGFHNVAGPLAAIVFRGWWQSKSRQMVFASKKYGIVVPIRLRVLSFGRGKAAALGTSRPVLPPRGGTWQRLRASLRELFAGRRVSDMSTGVDVGGSTIYFNTRR